MADILSRVSAVRGTAADYNGECTWVVSQIFDPIHSVIKKSDRTSNGICEILAAKWMADTLNIGRAGGATIQTPDTEDLPTKEVVLASIQNGGFKSWLGANQEAIDPAKVALLGQIHGTVNLSQGAGRDAWLQQNGLHKQKNAAGGEYRDIGGHSVGVDPEEIIETVKGRQRNFLPVAGLLNVQGKSFFSNSPHAHATAIYIQPPNTLLFFDPNFGEFTFRTVADFKNFFVNFWKASRYNVAFGQEYSIEYVGPSDLNTAGAGIGNLQPMP